MSCGRGVSSVFAGKHPPNPVNELVFAFAGHDLYDGRRIPSNRAKTVAL